MTTADPKPLDVFMPGAFAALPDALRAGFQSVCPDVALRFHAFVPSGDLAREIIAGATCDVFVSANPLFMNQVVLAGRTQRVFPLASNRLTIITRPDLRLAPTSLADTLTGESRLVVPQPETDPCGQYIRDLLADLGLLDQFQSRREAGLAMYSHGSGDLPGFLFDDRANVGIFYFSETIALGDRVRVIELPQDQDRRERIRFVIAAISNNGWTNPDAD